MLDHNPGLSALHEGQAERKDQGWLFLSTIKVALQLGEGENTRLGKAIEKQ